MNYFCCRSLESTNKIFQQYSLDDPVLVLVHILKSINNIFEKQLQGKPSLRQVVRVHQQNP